MADQKNPGRMYYINEIDQQLGRLVSWVEIANRNNRSDVSVISENILCGLLNRMYGWNLINANTPTHPNFPGVDLVDDKACVAVQITAQNTLDKVKDMLEKFFRHQLDERFSRLILMEITNQEPTQGMRSKKEGCFYGQRDIWNIPRLVRELQDADIEKLKEIAGYLEGEIGSLYTRTAPGKDPGKIKEKKPSLLRRILKKLDAMLTEAENQEAEEEEEDIPEEVPLTKVISDLLQKWKQTRPKKKKRKKSRRKKKWLLLLLPVLAAAVFFLIPDQPLEAMPPELADYTVTLNGQELSLPTTFARLEELGWVPEDPAEMEVWLAPGFSDRSITLINGDGEITAWYLNPSSHTLPVEDCVISGLRVSAYYFDVSFTGEKVNTLEGPLGLVLGAGSWKDVKWPRGYEKITGSAAVTYTYQLDGGHRYQFTFHKKTGVLSQLEITNQDPQTMAVLTGPAYETQPPEYDAQKLAEQLGVEMIFQAGDYRFPLGCTVSEYAELGYTLDKAPEFVTSGKSESVYYRCDTRNQVALEGCNPFARALIPEHCFVGILDSGDMSTNAEAIELICTFGDQQLTIREGVSTDSLYGQLESGNIRHKTDDYGSILIYPDPLREDIFIKCYVYKDVVTQIRADISGALRYYLFELQKSEISE